jgi:hypothetical protein
MPVLSNPKHEAFAQGLAKGKTQADAYQDAGYKGDKTAASRLSTNVNIIARRAELQAKVAAKTGRTVEDIVKALDEDRELARQNGQVAAAITASMGIAKLLGMLVDKAQIDVHHHYDDMSEEELDRELEQVLAEGIVTAH